jgi:glycosyltransferase involved in cell wall biosynthesis
MAMGVACVATRIDPITEAAKDGQEALLVPPRAPEPLAAALVTVLVQGELRDRLGRAARRRVEAEFSLERQVGLLEALYRVLASRLGAERSGG